MAVGRVVRFDEGRAYGFIAPDDGGEDVFVHANELMDRGGRIAAGTRVEFEVVGGERGPKAYAVRLLEPAQPAPPEAARAGNGTPPPAAHHGAPEGDELYEVFTEGEFVQQITELLLVAAPRLTGAEIRELRGHLLEFGRKNGWVD